MSMQAMLLGIAQDAGVPQAGCLCATCRRARSDPAFATYTAALGLIDRDAGAYWMVDATPDFKHQLHLLHSAAPACQLRGIVLTHAHIGHYTGLIHVGKEVMNTRALPVYATPSVCAFLAANGPWSQLVANGNIALCEVPAGGSFGLTDTCRVDLLGVPHRAEYSDTVALVVRGGAKSLFYCPDIDRWESWDRDVRAIVEGCDISLLDGSFFSGDELPGRDMRLVPHPLVTDTVARIAGVARTVRFIHFNHTNPLLVSDSPQLAWLRAHGFDIGVQGFAWDMD